MQINVINQIINYKKVSNLNKVASQSKIKNDTDYCSFQKRQNVSFGSINNADDFLDFNLIEEFIQTVVNEINKDIIEKINFEEKLHVVYSVSNSHRKALANLNGGCPIDIFITDCTQGQEETFDDVAKFLKANNIKVIKDLTKFLGVFYSIKNAEERFRYIYQEVLEVYSALEDKQDLAKNPELLIEIYDELLDNNGFPVEEFVKYENLLNKHNITSAYPLEDRLEGLKQYFDNFEVTGAKLAALNYIDATYKARIESLQEFAKNHPELKIKDVEKTYLQYAPYIDYVFEEDEYGSLDDLANRAEYLFKNHKYSNKIYTPFTDLFNNFENIGDKIDFWNFLKSNNISLADLEIYIKTSTISDIDVLDKVFAKDSTIKQYISLTNKKEAQAEIFYKDNCDILAAISKNKDESFDATAIYIDLANKFNIRSSKEFINFYNQITKNNVKQLTSKEIIDFIDLLRFQGDFKTNNKKDIDISKLKEKQEYYLIYEDEIKDYLNNATSDFFIGMSELDVFLKYSDALLKNDNIKNTLDDISKNTNSASKEKREKEFCTISEFFETEQESAEFIKQNDIILNKQGAEANYLNACIIFLNSLKSIYPKQEDFKQAVDKLSENNFFKKSKKELYFFINNKNISKNLDEIIKIIIDRKVQDVEQLGNFINKHLAKDKNIENIILHIQNAPSGFDFKNYAIFIKIFENKLRCFNRTDKITNDNILKINLNQETKNRERKIDCAIAEFLGSDSIHPVDNLKKPYLSTEYKNTKEEIARALLSCTDKVDNSGEIILKSLKINEKLDKNYADNLQSTFVAENIPDEFMELISYFNKPFLNSDKIPNITLHAKIRLLSRFIFNKTDIDHLDINKAKEEISNLLDIIYNKQPERYNEKAQGVVCIYKYNGEDIEAIFGHNGSMLTIYPKV